MKKRFSFLGLVVIVLAVTFIISDDVRATNCYDLYYNETCSNYDWENWDSVKLAMHRDKSWEAVGPIGFGFSGHWNVFGNAIYLKIANSVAPYTPDCLESLPLLAGVKKGQAKLLEDPYKSKANIKKAQGFWLQDDGVTIGCWYLQKVKINQCPWISE